MGVSEQIQAAIDAAATKQAREELEKLIAKQEAAKTQPPKKEEPKLEPKLSVEAIEQKIRQEKQKLEAGAKGKYEELLRRTAAALADSTVLELIEKEAAKWKRENPLADAREAFDKLNAMIKAYGAVLFKEDIYIQIKNDIAKELKMLVDEKITPAVKEAEKIFSSGLNGVLNPIPHDTPEYKEILEKTKDEIRLKVMTGLDQALDDKVLHRLEEITRKIQLDPVLDEAVRPLLNEAVAKVSQQVSSQVENYVKNKVLTEKVVTEAAKVYYDLRQVQKLKEKLSFKNIKNELKAAAEEALKRETDKIIADISSKISISLAEGIKKI